MLRAASDAAPAGRALATQTRRVVPDRMPAAFASQERFLARRARAAQHGAVPGRAPIQPIDPVHPQPRHIARAIAVLEAGGLVSYPTDTYYAIGCDLFQKRAIEKMAMLKRRDPKKPFAFLCGDLGEVAKYAIVDNERFRLLRRLLPGPYTVILPATRVVPRTVPGWADAIRSNRSPSPSYTVWDGRWRPPAPPSRTRSRSSTPGTSRISSVTGST